MTDDQIMLCFNLFFTFITGYMFYLLSPKSNWTNAEKELFIIGSLGAPVTIPLLTIVSWLFYFSH
jgi:hypothetical protein